MHAYIIGRKKGGRNENLNIFNLYYKQTPESKKFWILDLVLDFEIQIQIQKSKISKNQIQIQIQKSKISKKIIQQNILNKYYQFLARSIIYLEITVLVSDQGI